jgi:hypothetical protein
MIPSGTRESSVPIFLKRIRKTLVEKNVQVARKSRHGSSSSLARTLSLSRLVSREFSMSTTKSAQPEQSV